MNMKPILTIVSVIIIGLALFFGYKISADQYTVKPEKIYAENFRDDISKISDLTGGGKISGDYDLWIHFKQDTLAGFKGRKEFEETPADMEMARRWFAENTPLKDDPSLGPTQRQYLKLYNHMESLDTKLDHEWLLHNWRTNDHFFRTWGY